MAAETVTPTLAQFARRYPAMSPKKQTAVRHLIGLGRKDD